MVKESINEPSFCINDYDNYSTFNFSYPECEVDGNEIINLCSFQQLSDPEKPARVHPFSFFNNVDSWETLDWDDDNDTSADVFEDDFLMRDALSSLFSEQQNRSQIQHGKEVEYGFLPSQSFTLVHPELVNREASLMSKVKWYADTFDELDWDREDTSVDIFEDDLTITGVLASLFAESQEKSTDQEHRQIRHENSYKIDDVFLLSSSLAPVHPVMVSRDPNASINIAPSEVKRTQFNADSCEDFDHHDNEDTSVYLKENAGTFEANSFLLDVLPSVFSQSCVQKKSSLEVACRRLRDPKLHDEEANQNIIENEPSGLFDYHGKRDELRSNPRRKAFLLYEKNENSFRKRHEIEDDFYLLCVRNKLASLLYVPCHPMMVAERKIGGSRKLCLSLELRAKRSSLKNQTTVEAVRASFEVGSTDLKQFVYIIVEMGENAESFNWLDWNESKIVITDVLSSHFFIMWAAGEKQGLCAGLILKDPGKVFITVKDELLVACIRFCRRRNFTFIH